ncbi:MAG: RHS repeat protein [Candidatus Eremiobacteraeota bacterium]|nr:RHS repeat protein [Candidatus Eremiobacteraeota bacterium]
MTYDNNGNLTQSTNNTTGETTSYEWNCHNRMTKVTLPA